MGKVMVTKQAKPIAMLRVYDDESLQKWHQIDLWCPTFVPESGMSLEMMTVT